MIPKRKTCEWIIAPIGRLAPIKQCQAPATHWCKYSGRQYCDDHAEDMADIFGDDSFREFPIEEAKP